MNCTIGYKIDKNHTQCGFATEALSKAIDILFDDLNFHRIEALIHPENIASIRLIEKLNFDFEGIAKSSIRLDNVWYDHLRYARINPY